MQELEVFLRKQRFKYCRQCGRHTMAERNPEARRTLPVTIQATILVFMLTAVVVGCSCLSVILLKDSVGTKILQPIIDKTRGFVFTLLSPTALTIVCAAIIAALFFEYTY